MNLCPRELLCYTNSTYEERASLLVVKYSGSYVNVGELDSWSDVDSKYPCLVVCNPTRCAIPTSCKVRETKPCCWHVCVCTSIMKVAVDEAVQIIPTKMPFLNGGIEGSGSTSKTVIPVYPKHCENARV